MSFVLFARAHGVEVGDLIASDRIRRCATVEKPRSKNGAYFWDGDRGWVMAWDGDGKTHWYDDPNAKPWTEEEKRAWALKRRTQAAEQERKYQNAALQAAMLLRSAVPGYHDYLIRKKLGDVQGLCLPDKSLLVPMRNLRTNDLQGAQIIRWLPDALKWEKKMVPGMRAKGAVLRVGPKAARETMLCEGYATGLSIEMAARQSRLSMAVLVCFSSSNLIHVASLLGATRAGIFADNDKSNTGREAAEKTGLPYVMADEVGFDANDLYAKHGAMAVVAKLIELRKKMEDAAS